MVVEVSRPSEARQLFATLSSPVILSEVRRIAERSRKPALSEVEGDPSHLNATRGVLEAFSRDV